MTHTHHYQEVRGRRRRRNDQEVHSETELSDMSQRKSADCDILHYDSVEIHAKMNKMRYNPCAHLTPFQLVSVYLPVSLTSCNSNEPVPTTGLSSCSFLKKVAVKQLHVDQNTNGILNEFHHGFQALKLLY